MSTAELLLPPREIPDAIQRALVTLLTLGLLFDLRLRLVIRALLPLQFPIEQVGQILPLPAVAAAVRTAGLLHHLPPAHVCLRLQQPVERFHLVRDRFAGPA